MKVPFLTVSVFAIVYTTTFFAATVDVAVVSAFYSALNHMGRCRECQNGQEVVFLDRKKRYSGSGTLCSQSQQPSTNIMLIAGKWSVTSFVCQMSYIVLHALCMNTSNSHKSISLF